MPTRTTLDSATTPAPPLPAANRPTGRPRPVRMYPTGLERLDQLAARHAELVAAHAAAAAAAKESIAARRAAELADERAAVDAVKAGQRDPGQPLLAAASEAAADAQRLARVRLRAADEVGAEVVAEWRRQEGAVADVVRVRVEEARRGVLDLLDELAGAVEQLTAARLEAQWAQRGPLANTGSRLAERERVRLGDGRSFVAEAVLELLRTAVMAPSAIERGHEPVGYGDGAVGGRVPEADDDIDD